MLISASLIKWNVNFHATLISITLFWQLHKRSILEISHSLPDPLPTLYQKSSKQSFHFRLYLLLCPCCPYKFWFLCERHVNFLHSDILLLVMLISNTLISWTINFLNKVSVVVNFLSINFYFSVSTSLACTLPYPGEKHLAITSEDCNQAVCYPDTITWTLDNCWWLFSWQRGWFPNKTLFLALFPPSSLSWLSKCTSSCNFISKEEKRPWKLLQIVASF